MGLKKIYKLKKEKMFEGKYLINKDTAGVDIRGHSGKWLKAGKLRIHRKASGGWNTAGSHIPSCAFTASKGREGWGENGSAYIFNVQDLALLAEAIMCINCPITSIFSHL